MARREIAIEIRGLHTLHVTASDHGRSRGKKKPEASPYCGGHFVLLLTPLRKSRKLLTTATSSTPPYPERRDDEHRSEQGHQAVGVAQIAKSTGPDGLSDQRCRL
jgi:hypothetical protein